MKNYKKGYKKRLLVCIAACSMLLSGCGEALHELTVEEEDLIVHYAAYVIAKHNIQQKDGMSGVYIPEAGEEDSIDAPIDSENPDGTQNPDGSTGNGQTVDNSTITMAEAVGHGGDLTITYTGAYTADNYVESSAYAMDAQAGKTFYIMKFTIANTTQADVYVENITKGLSFKLVSGDMKVASEVTFLMSDFSTYVGTVAAGQAVETVLLFEVSESDAESITEPKLEITIDGAVKNIKL